MTKQIIRIGACILSVLSATIIILELPNDFPIKKMIIVGIMLIILYASSLIRGAAEEAQDHLFENTFDD